jgi:hypothetical protein
MEPIFAPVALQSLSKIQAQIVPQIQMQIQITLPNQDIDISTRSRKSRTTAEGAIERLSLRRRIRSIGLK